MATTSVDIAKPKRSGATRGLQLGLLFSILVIVALVIALIVVVSKKDREIEDLKKMTLAGASAAMNQTGGQSGSSDSVPCPPKRGGLVSEGEPAQPGPFHDVTEAELLRLYTYLRSLPELNLQAPDKIRVNTSSVFMVDLLLPPKADVLSYLNSSNSNSGGGGGGVSQPPREAKVMMFRGDLSPPVVQEYRVGPLSNPTYAELLTSSHQRNPVEFNVRPIGVSEFLAIFEKIAPEVDEQVKTVLLDSYGGRLTNCEETNNCLKTIFITAATGVLNEMKRKYWMVATYPGEYYHIHPLDFGILFDISGSDQTQWRAERFWYSGFFYETASELVSRFQDTDNPINKTHIRPFVSTTPDLRSAQFLRGDPVPETPMRPPVQVEPDGKRYTIDHREVSYLQWKFHFRMSPFHGPQVYDIRFNGERIAYELGLSDLAVFYSGSDPMIKYMNFMDGGVLIGTHSKTLVPGADCPEGATYVGTAFLGEYMTEPTKFPRAFCVFEINTGNPLRRHMSYTISEGGYYGGMSASTLVVRSILTIINYDYVVDYVFHQNGAVEVRAMSTGSIIASFSPPDGTSPYGYNINENIIGNVHHHIFHFKADLDILGTSNRYQTLDIVPQQVDKDQMGPNITPGEKFTLTEIQEKLYHTEQQALFKYNFDHPKYHIVHNQQYTTEYGLPRAYRLKIEGMSKQLLPEDQDNEKTIPWARHQMAVTVHKDDEGFSSSPYAMFDSFNPVVNFTDFYSDNQTIVDQDLVFWVTMGVHHIPHTEDLPVTPTVGGHLQFFLLPNNYFPECPSVASRDAVRYQMDVVQRRVTVDLHGNQPTNVCGAPSIQDLVSSRTADMVQTNPYFSLF